MLVLIYFFRNCTRFARFTVSITLSNLSMMEDSLSNNDGVRLATRLSFFVAGFGLAAWAPLVPLIKQELQLDEGVLGALLLCLGGGSVVAMLGTAALSARYGTKSIIVLSGLALALTLPVLAVAGNQWELAIALAIFGAALGTLDVAINLNAVIVEREAQKPLMSGFHAMFSVGGFAGSAMMTSLLSARAGAGTSTAVAASIMMLAMLLISPRLKNVHSARKTALFAVPRGVVMMLALLAGITFLVEGAILDWGGVLLTDSGLVQAAHGGAGYICFSMAMLAARFGGDAVIARWGDRTVLFWGGALAVAGIAAVLMAELAWMALAGFFLIGIGAANIVPILFRLAGRQRTMPPGLAVAVISTVGYAGVLVGPAGIGLVAKHAGLAVSFALLGALLCVVPALAYRVTHGSNPAKEAS